MQNFTFEKLVEAQKANIYAVCYMFAEHTDDADDIFQEVLINMWKGFSSFRREAEISTWVYRIALNTCISYKRKSNRRKAKTEIDPTAFFETAHDALPYRRLHDRIRHLDPFERAITLLWLEDISYDEIGAIMGISAKSVGVRLVRIKEKLKKIND